MSETVDSLMDLDKAGTLGERLFEHLLEAIHGGKMPAGSAISESALAVRFGVSRGPVREAVRRLQGINLVSREPFLRARVLALSSADVLELFQMREALEGYACRLAAERMGDADLVLLGEDLEAQRAASIRSDRPPAQADVNDFHIRIVQGSGNQRIINALCGDVYRLIRLYRKQSGAVADRKQIAFQEHWQILRAMRARDGALAESLMRSHIARATSQLERLLARDGPGATARLNSMSAELEDNPA